VNGGGLDGTDFDYEVQSIIGSGHGDADLNQRVTFTDFVSLTNNYGADLSSGVSAQETVPEPASLVLLSLAFSFVAKRRA